MTQKKFRINNNKCKICKEMPVKHNGLCRLCAKSLVVVNNMLNHDFGIGTDHSCYPFYMGSVYSKLEEMKNTIRNVTGENISYLTLSILEATESKMGHREKATYVTCMKQHDVIKVLFAEDNGRIPTDDEVSKIMEKVNNPT